MRTRIAIVDDEVTVCRRLSQALSRDGYEVEAFTTGRSFLERMQEGAFDIVFCDLRLPDTSGMDVLARMQSGPERNRGDHHHGLWDHRQRYRGHQGRRLALCDKASEAQ